jgi:DNA helicase-4
MRCKILTKEECKDFISKLPNEISEDEKLEIKAILKRIEEKFFSTSSIQKESQNSEINFDKDQLKAINCTAKNILLKARAGSGKTAVLVERAKKLLARGEKVLLLAFNKKASLEMKKSVGNGFQNAKTFHSFAYSIIKPNSDILMEREQLLYIQKFIPKNNLNAIGNDEISQKKSNSSSDYFVNYIRNRFDYPLYSLSGDKVKSNGEKWIADFLFEHDIKFEYEKKFNWNNGIYNPDFTIENRIVLEHWGIDENDPNGKTPDDWTKSWQDYKNEMNEKRAFWKSRKEIFLETSINDLKSREEFEKLLKSKLESQKIILKKVSDSKIQKRVINNFPTIYKITERIEKYISTAKSKKWDYEKLDKKIKSFFEEKEFLNLANKIYLEYEKSEKTDFDDLLIQATKNIQKNQISKLKHILIDEFQDFNPLFYNLIKRILELKPEINIFAVGDDWQGINGFAGADLEYFKNFEKYFDKPEILQMNRNYRSKKAIVDYGNEIMQGFGSEAISTRDGGEILEVSEIPKDRKITFITRINAEKSQLKEKNITQKITAHKSKGLQYDEVIIQKSSFQKDSIHSENRFYKIFGKSEEEIKEEEKRLYYVAVTRAKERVHILETAKVVNLNL